MPPEVVENHFASFTVISGDVDGCSHPIGEVGICVTQRSTMVALPLGSRVPLSRGATCTAGKDGREAPLLTIGGPPCPLTDGLADTGLEDCAVAGCPEDVVVDLGAVTTISTVLVHDATVDSSPGATMVVETSSDGANFTEVARVTADQYWSIFRIVPLDTPIQARQVRLRVLDGHLQHLSELAVF